MLIEENSPEFDTLFKKLDVWEQFESYLPSHDTLVQAMGDPSLDPYSAVNVDLLNNQGVSDLQRGTRRMIQKIVLPGNINGTFGFLGSSMQALEKIMQFESLPDLMGENEVYAKLGVAVQGQNPAQAIKKVAFAIGMSALSAMGPIGAAAAAIIGFGVAIRNAFKSKKIRDAEAKEQALLEAYQSFPPLQEPRRDVDTDTINLQLLPHLQSGDWTPIFSPRFQGASWRAIPRIGGFALALGDEEPGHKNPLGEEMSVFRPTGGVGFWPGQNRITSVIQASLDPASTRVQRYLNGFHQDFLLEQPMVRDVGDFLVNTNKLASIAWSWVSELENSPHLFKVDVPKLHRLWSDYCQKGLQAIIERPNESRTRQDFYSSVIACAVGTWQCWHDEGRYKNIGGRHHGRDMGYKGHTTGQAGPKTWAPNRHPRRGCVIAPYESNIGNPRCLTTIYETQTRLILDQVAQRQRWYLRHSLLCAYVRRSWAAFQGPENKALRDLLDQMRVTLLDHPDRQFVVLDDVPPGEPLPDGRELREELIKRGVGKGVKEFGRLAASPGWIEPPKDPAPGVSPGGRMPFGNQTLTTPEEAEPNRPWWSDRRVLGAGIGLAVGGGLLWWNRR